MLLDSYNKNGFYIARSAFTKDEINLILSETNLIIKQQLKLLALPCKETDNQNSIFLNLKTLFDNDLERYLKLVKILSKNRELIKIFFSDKITALLKDLKIEHCIFPTDPAFHIMSEELRIPGGYYGFVPHQDYTSMQGSLDAPAIWIPLVDIDKNLYPLEVIPASNHRGMLKGEMKNNCYEVDNSLYKNEDFIPIEVNAGDVVLMSSFTIHRSSLNGRPNSVRLACSARFDNLEEESFIKRVYPTVYKRVVERVLLEPGFPSLEQVKNIFK